MRQCGCHVLNSPTPPAASVQPGSHWQWAGHPWQQGVGMSIQPHFFAACFKSMVNVCMGGACTPACRRGYVGYTWPCMPGCMAMHACMHAWMYGLCPGFGLGVIQLPSPFNAWMHMKVHVYACQGLHPCKVGWQSPGLEGNACSERRDGPEAQKGTCWAVHGYHQGAVNSLESIATSCGQIRILVLS